MKYAKYLFTIFIVLGSVLIGVSNVKAQVVNGVDYRVMETGTPIEIGAYQFNPIIINEDNGGFRISTWLNYMQANNLHKIEIQSGKLSTFYLYYGTTEELLAYNVFKMELGYDTGFAYFFMRLYSLTQVLLEEIVLAHSETQWELPRDTRILTDVNFQITDDVYGRAYDLGYKDGRADYGEYFPEGSPDGMDGWYGYQDGFDYGYEYGIIDYGYNDNGVIITAEKAFDKGYSAGTQESGELKAQIIDFVPGVLGAIFMFFFQMGQIGILGITILDILGMIILISSLIFLIKFFF